MNDSSVFVRSVKHIRGDQMRSDLPVINFVWTGLAVCVAIVSYTISPYIFQIYCLVIVAALAALGLNIIMGWSGQVSLGHAAFVGLGAYGTSVLMVQAHLECLLALAGGMALTGVVGWIVGWIGGRLQPLYLAMVTFVFVEAFQLVATNWQSISGGADGLAVTQGEIFGWQLGEDHLIYVLLPVAVAVFWISGTVLRGRPGRALRALRGSPYAAQACGIDLVRYKVGAFTVGSLIAGLAGGLYALLIGFVNPDSFSFAASILYVTMIVVGGMTSMTGTIVGAAIFTVLPQVTSTMSTYSGLIGAALLLVALLTFRDGLVGLLKHARSSRKLRAAATVVAGASRNGRAYAWLAHGGLDSQLAVATGEHNDARTDEWDTRDLVVELKQVSCQFGGVQALDSVDLRVYRGEIHGLAGPNGSGKSTLINLLSRLYRPSAGRVWALGEDLGRRRASELASMGIARTFQNLELFQGMSVEEHVLVGMHRAHHGANDDRSGNSRIFGTYSIRRRWATERTNQLIAMFNLEQFRDEQATSLPLATQRLVEIARALACRPSLLLLDEPTAGLTEEELAELAQALRAVRDAWGTAMIIVAHTIGWLTELADTLTVLDSGRVIAHGEPSVVMEDQGVIQAYMGANDVPTS